MPDFDVLWRYIIIGLAFGGTYALTGTSLVVLYRTTGVVNLAFGAIGCMGTHIMWTLMGGDIKNPTPRVHGWGVLAYPGLVLLCALMSLAYGWLLAPLLAKRDPLVKALGTVAVALFLLGIMKEGWDSTKTRELPFPTKTFKFGGAVVTTTQVIALVFSIVLVILVTLLLERTAIGTAMRAIADDRNVAALLGVPVRRIEAIAWFGSGAIGGCVYMLIPSFFKNLDQNLLTWFVIGALGGAIVGQLKSLWVTFFASVGIGVIESGLTPLKGSFQFLKDYQKLTPFVVAVLAILWISRRRTVVLSGREMQ
jgi:branched-chain amino acid transport system permease protein